MSAPASSVYGCTGTVPPRITERSDLDPELRARIRTLQRLEPRRTVHRLVAFIVLGGTGAGITFGVPHWTAHVLGTLLEALSLVGLSVMMHEGSHHLLFRSRSLSRAIGFGCGLPVLISVSAYRVLHLRHHAHERTDRDPDDVEHVVRRPAGLVAAYYALLVMGTYLYLPHVALAGLGAGTRRDRLRVLAEYGLILLVHGVGWRLAPAAMLHGWLLPMLLASQITNLRGLAEHGLTTAGSPFTATRSVVSNRVVSFVFCNLNYHLEHHLFPAVPWYNLPALHRLLLPVYPEAGASVYRSYREFLRDFVRTTRGGLVPNVRLLPAHLREELCV